MMVGIFPSQNYLYWCYIIALWYMIHNPEWYCFWWFLPTPLIISIYVTEYLTVTIDVHTTNFSILKSFPLKYTNFDIIGSGFMYEFTCHFIDKCCDAWLKNLLKPRAKTHNRLWCLPFESNNLLLSFRIRWSTLGFCSLGLTCRYWWKEEW